jgi:hypothetical protein
LHAIHNGRLLQKQHNQLRLGKTGSGIIFATRFDVLTFQAAISGFLTTLYQPTYSVAF